MCPFLFKNFVSKIKRVKDTLMGVHQGGASVIKGVPQITGGPSSGPSVQAWGLVGAGQRKKIQGKREIGSFDE